MALQRELKPGGNPARLFFTASPRCTKSASRSPHSVQRNSRAKAASGFLARQKQRWQLRIVDGTATMQRHCVRVRAIAREALPQIGQPHIGAVLLDQVRETNPVPNHCRRTPTAFDPLYRCSFRTVLGGIDWAWRC